MLTEKEKMLNGEPYYPADRNLAAERNNAKKLCFEYNSLPPSKGKKKQLIIKKLFGKTDENFLIEPFFNCDYGYNIEIGKNFYMNHNGVILDCAKVTFGDNVLIGPNCGFYTTHHPIETEARICGYAYASPIIIGNNVWIGGNVVVLPGVTIGANTVIGAGSVVNRNIPENVIAAGNPCKVIREITDEDLKEFEPIPE